jgi:WD40 repeat protein
VSALFLRKFDPKTQKFEEMANIRVEDSIRTVSFNPINSNLIAVGLFNGRVQIINISTQKVEQKVNLSGG